MDARKEAEFFQLYADVATSSESEGEQQPAKPVTTEMLDALARQVEFYLSDANLPTDKKLLKMILKGNAGFVPVKLFGNFRKVRALTKDVEVIARSLQNSKMLELSPDAKHVRRIIPIPDYDIVEIQKRMLLVENLPPAPTIESVTNMFVEFGSVVVVRICGKEGKSKLPNWLTIGCHNPLRQHAFVEYEEQDEAARAAAAVFEPEDSRSQLKINRLTPQLPQDSQGGRGRTSKGSSVRCSRDVSPTSHGGHCSSRPGELHSSSPYRRSDNGLASDQIRASRRYFSGDGSVRTSWAQDPQEPSPRQGSSSQPGGSPAVDKWLRAGASGAGAARSQGGGRSAGLYVPPARRSMEAGLTMGAGASGCPTRIPSSKSLITAAASAIQDCTASIAPTAQSRGSSDSGMERVASVVPEPPADGMNQHHQVQNAAVTHSPAKPHIPKAPVLSPSQGKGTCSSKTTPLPQAAVMSTAPGQLTSNAHAALSAMLADVLVAAEQKQRQVDIGAGAEQQPVAERSKGGRKLAPKFCLGGTISRPSNGVGAACKTAGERTGGGGVRTALPLRLPADDQKLASVDCFISSILASIPAGHPKVALTAATVSAAVQDAPAGGIDSRNVSAAHPHLSVASESSEVEAASAQQSGDCNFTAQSDTSAEPDNAKVAGLPGHTAQTDLTIKSGLMALARPPLPAHSQQHLALSLPLGLSALRQRQVMSEGGAQSPRPCIPEGCSSDDEGEEGDCMTEGGAMAEGAEGGAKRQGRRRRRRTHSKRTTVTSDAGALLPMGDAIDRLDIKAVDATIECGALHDDFSRQWAGSDGGGVAQWSASAGGSDATLRVPAKKPSKKDYAFFAAATPEYRAEATAKYGVGGLLPLAAGEGISGLAARLVETSPLLLVSAAQEHAGHHHHVQEQAHISKGPDGSRGFALTMVRGRPLQPQS